MLASRFELGLLTTEGCLIATCAVAPARAKFDITLVQLDNNVVMQGTGSLDLTEFYLSRSNSEAGVSDDPAAVSVGGGIDAIYYGVIGRPTTIGPGGRTFATSV